MGNAMVKVGAIGLLIWFVAAILIVVGALLALARVGFANPITFVGYIIGGVGGLLGSLGLFGVWKGYGGGFIPVYSFIHGLVASILLLVAGILCFAAPFYGAALLFAAFPLMGAYALLYGLVFVLWKDEFKVGFGLITGILMIVGGELMTSFLGNSFGISQFLLIPATLLGFLVLLKAP